MTHVFGLRRNEMIALSLGRNFATNGKQITHFARGDIPKIRRMAWDGKSADQMISELGLEMSVEVFRRRCKELQIKLRARGRPRGR